MVSRCAGWIAADRTQVIINSLFGLLFLMMIPISLATGLKQSVPWLVFLSLWALVAAHWSGALAAWAALRVDRAGNESGGS